MTTVFFFLNSSDIDIDIFFTCYGLLVKVLVRRTGLDPDSAAF